MVDYRRKDRALAFPRLTVAAVGTLAAATMGWAQTISLQRTENAASVNTDARLQAALEQLIATPVFPLRDTRSVLPPAAEPLRSEMETHIVRWVTGPRLAPLRVDIGLAGEEIFFADSGEVFLALAFAYPHLSQSARGCVREFLAKEWDEHLPLGPRRVYSPKEGKRRELYTLPPGRLADIKPGGFPHPLVHTYAVWAWGYYADEASCWPQVWTTIRELWQDFRREKLPLKTKDDALWANAYLGGLIAVVRIARHVGDNAVAFEAQADAEQLAAWVVNRFRQHAALLIVPEIRDVNEFDRWRADELAGLFLVFRPHKAKPDKFHALLPEVGMLLKGLAPEESSAYLKFVDKTLPGWYLVGEERQFHYGENFMDYPDFVLAIFLGQAYLGERTFRELSAWVDLPISEGDPYFVHKAAIALHIAAMERARR